jgi:uncharacterized protein YndB with AHSA1/START domain
MAARNGTASAERAAEPELVITRVFDAPRELVFKAWTEPERLVRWWGPKGFTTPLCKIDLRPGGVWHWCQRSPEGREFWCKGFYREIVEPERIVLSVFFSDEEGNFVEPERYGMSPDFPLQMLVTVTFAEHDGKTKLIMHQTILESVAEGIGAGVQAWNESFDRLAGFLTQD